MDISKRDYKVDILRTIGLLGIILAHVSPPNILMQFRTFDVPLMVIASGIAYGISIKKYPKSVSYYKHRILRLLAPVWFFLLIYFSYFYVVDLFTGEHSISLKLFVKSFLLVNNGGIGYLWIIKVFILVAISAPIIQFANTRIKSNLLYYSLIAIFFAFYFYLIEFSFISTFIENKKIQFILSEYILYLVPYSLLFSIGVRINSLSNQQILLLISLLLLFFLYLNRVYSDMNLLTINNFKYPPKSLWVIYGIIMSLFIYFLTRFNDFRSRYFQFFYFLSFSSMWIYLWHIFILSNWGRGISYIPDFANHYIIKFLIVILLASFITYFQKVTFHYILQRYELPNYFKKSVAIIFLK